MSSPSFGSERRAVVLMAEDDPDHVLLTEIAFERAKLLVDLRVVTNGEECMQFLRRQGAHADAPQPDLLLLDLHMPRMDGYEVMHQIDTDPALRSLPVVVLSSSADPRDWGRLYAMRCSSFITKPVDFDQFVMAVQSLSGYWLSLVRLPTSTP